MKEIRANNGWFAIIQVDDEDYGTLNKYTWCTHTKGNNTYVETNINGKTVGMHQLLMPQCESVDHKDRNGLNNQKINLRCANKAQNDQNSAKRKNCSSVYKGVVRRKNGYQARITVGGYQIELGLFNNEKEAAIAYNEAATLNFGEFARLNEIKE